MYRKIYLSDIEKLIDCEFSGNDYLIESLNFCDRISKHEVVLSYVTSKKYIEIFSRNDKVKALFIAKELLPYYQGVKECAFFVVDNPEEAFYTLHHKLIEETNFYNNNSKKKQSSKGFHSSIIIEQNVQIGKNVKIGYNSVIKSGTIIKDNVTIEENVVIGCEGFQIINISGIMEAIKHAGGVLIGNNVFIAAGSTISKSLFEGEVIINNNTKIDSQVHIGHNCKVGENTVITGNSLLMGSVTIGDNVWIAPSSTISNKVYLESGTFVGSSSLVNRNSLKGEKIMGNPAVGFNDYMRLLIEQKKIILLKKQK